MQSIARLIFLMLIFSVAACGTVKVRTPSYTPLTAGLDAYERGDYSKALEFLKPLAEGGEALAQVRLGNMYFLGLGVAEDDREAAKWLRKAAEQGDLEAQINLGTLYVMGAGVPQDYTEAARLFRVAAESGIGGAQFLLGMLYVYGKGVPEDLVQAYLWIELASEKGSKAALEMRETLRLKMTPEQISQAQQLRGNSQLK
jgi:uncharacterized protein